MVSSAFLLYPLLDGEIMADQGVPGIDHCPPSTQKAGLILCAPKNPGTNRCMMEMACFLLGELASVEYLLCVTLCIYIFFHQVDSCSAD